MDSLELFQQREGLIELSLLDDNFSIIETAVETLESSVTTLQTDVSSLTSALSISGGTSSVLYVDSANKRLGVGDANSPDATLEVEGDGSPLILNSKNSTNNKIILKDAGAIRSYIGSSFSDSLLVKNSTNQTVLRASSSGNVTAPLQAGFSTRFYGAQTISVGNLDTLDNWSPTFGNAGYNSGSLDLVSGVFTAPVNGRYLFNVTPVFNTSAGITNWYIYVNSDIAYQGRPPAYSSFSHIVELSVNDTVDIRVQNLSANVDVISGWTYWSGTLLI